MRGMLNLVHGTLKTTPREQTSVTTKGTTDVVVYNTLRSPGTKVRDIDG